MDNTLESFKELGIEEIKKFMRRTKPATYPNNPIPSKFIKRNIDILTPTIKDIVNNSLKIAHLMVLGKCLLSHHYRRKKVKRGHCLTIDL